MHNFPVLGVAGEGKGSNDMFAKLRKRRSSNGAANTRPGAGNVGYLPETPLDGGVISCQVHDDQGRLLPGAVVTINDRMNQVLAQAETDTYGSFLATVQPGLHKISISAGGFKRKSARVEVRVNQHTSLGGVRLDPDDSLALPQPGVWNFDPTHTEIHFIAQHVGMSKIRGRFNDFEGRIQVAPRFEDSRIDVVIDAASIDTGVDARDTHLRSADFLDVEKYPKLYFTSTRFTQVRGDKWQIDGTFTLRGTSSHVQLDTTYLGQRTWDAPGWDSNRRVAARASTSLRREDYAVNWQATLAKGIAVVGPTVEIEIGVQAVLEM